MDIKPIKRAVIMLDQSTGELREDEDIALGLDIWPEVERNLEELKSSEVDVTLALPSEISADDLQGLSAWVPGLNIVAVPSAFSAATGDGFTSGLQLPAADEETAFVSSDRNLRGKADYAGLKPAQHTALLPMMAKGKRIEAVRLTGPRDTLWKLGELDEIVPMHFQPTCGAGTGP